MLWPWPVLVASHSDLPMFFNVANQGGPGRSSDNYTGTLAPSPGYSHVFNVARRKLAAMKMWEWPGNETTGTLLGTRLHIDISVH